MTGGARYIHATAVVVGECGILIRGASGSGKSRLALALMAEAERRVWFARLIGDDRVALNAVAGRLLARGHPRVAGLVERRGHGLCAVPHEGVCVIDQVVDLSPDRPPRLPDAAEHSVNLEGVELPRAMLPERVEVLDVIGLVQHLFPTAR